MEIHPAVMIVEILQRCTNIAPLTVVPAAWLKVTRAVYPVLIWIQLVEFSCFFFLPFRGVCLRQRIKLSLLCQFALRLCVWGSFLWSGVAVFPEVLGLSWVGEQPEWLHRILFVLELASLEKNIQSGGL